MDSDGDSSSLIFVVIGAAAAYILFSLTERTEPNLKHLPTFGYAGYILSYIDALRFLFDGPTIIRIGYEKCQSGIFKMATLHRWLVIVNGTQFMEELRKAPDDKMSIVHAPLELDISSHLSEYFHTRNSVDEAGNITRHITQNLPFLIPEIADEIQSLILVASAEGWKEFDVKDLVDQLTTRPVNRAFVGLPLARDREYSLLAVLSISKETDVKSKFLHSLLPSWFVLAARSQRHMRKLLTSIVHEQRNVVAGRGPTDDRLKSNDILSRIIANEINLTKIDDITSNILNLSLSALHALSVTLIHLLHNLAANPGYAYPMREEIQTVVRKDGWTRNSVDKMHKVDSFIKESMRINGTPSLSTMRKTLTSFTFSDGTCIPANSFLASAASPRHYDDALYPAAQTFDGFRFSSLHEKFHGGASSGIKGGVRFQLTTTTPEYLAWGYGRHACPGRFFAAVVLKMILGHVVLNYDVKLSDSALPQPPQPEVVQSSSEVKLLIRRR